MDKGEIFLLFSWSFILPYLTSSFEVRIVGGSRFAGRVEVYRNGQWGTVCDDFWDFNDANVVCRQLGFVGAKEAIRGAAFGVGRGPIHFDNVDCIGNEVTLKACNHLILHNCFHVEDAGVICKEQSYEEGDIRLVANFIVTVSVGTVQVFTAGSWNDLRVCVDTFDWKDAAVICRQLGFNMAAAFLFNNDIIIQYSYIKTTLNCSGDETKLDECPQNVCTDVRSVFIYCKKIAAHTTTTVTTAEDNDRCNSLEDKARLSGGNVTTGRVELCLNERWGTVCDNNWDIQDAEVVCRELGFKRAEAAILEGRFGPGTGPVHVGEVGCFGNETSIFSCDYTDSTHCEHEEDAGVSCIPYRAGDVRLVDGNLTSGFVEVYVADQWATVCGRDWELKEATVACRQLGFKSVLSVFKSVTHRNSSMVVDQVNCTGEETSLQQCKHKEDSHCKYHEYAFVLCSVRTDEKMDPIQQDGKESRSRLIIFAVLVGILICILVVTSVYRFWTIRCNSIQNSEERNLATLKMERPLSTTQQEMKNKTQEHEEGQYQMIMENSEATPYQREIYNSAKETSMPT